MEREKQREKERQSRQQQVSENNVKDKKELFGSPVKVISHFVIYVLSLYFIPLSIIRLDCSTISQRVVFFLGVV